MFVQFGLLQLTRVGLEVDELRLIMPKNEPIACAFTWGADKELWTYR